MLIHVEESNVRIAGPSKAFTPQTDKEMDIKSRLLNSLPLILFISSPTATAGQVVISEIMYHPKEGGHEFVEIENLTSSPFDIARWKLSGGVNFEFPEFSSAQPRNTFLKAFEKIVICDTDPGTFRASYGLPSAVRVFGPWSGNLDNGGEIAKNLQSLYSYMFSQLIEANMEKKTEPVEVVIDLLKELRSAWFEINKKNKNDKATQKPVTGLQQNIPDQSEKRLNIKG